jgi:hypothetical protein
MALLGLTARTLGAAVLVAVGGATVPAVRTLLVPVLLLPTFGVMSRRAPESVVSVGTATMDDSAGTGLHADGTVTVHPSTLATGLPEIT